MNFNPNMDPDVQKLVQLLRKILTKHPKLMEHMEQLSKMADGKSVHLNICILTLVPMSPEELEDLHEMYEEYLSRAQNGFESRDDVELEFRLTRDDLEFLKDHGLQF